jgi:hypothetical protein
MKQVLSFDQTKHLQELGLYHIYTLQDILDKLPRYINDFGTKYKLHIEPTFAGPWCISYQIGICEPFVFKLAENLLDAAYDMLCWCIENGYVKVGKEE